MITTWSVHGGIQEREETREQRSKSAYKKFNLFIIQNVKFQSKLKYSTSTYMAIKQKRKQFNLF